MFNRKTPLAMTQPMYHWDVTDMIPREDDDYMPSSSVSDARLYFGVVDLGGPFQDGIGGLDRARRFLITRQHPFKRLGGTMGQK